MLDSITFTAPEPVSVAYYSHQFVHRLRQHPFIRRCREQSIDQRSLEIFLVQHGKYGQYFTRYLCALMSNLAERDDVARLAENLVEEMGYGDHGGVPHAQLYQQMLAEFGLNVEQYTTYPETEALIQTMLSLCRQPGAVAGLGALCLGAEAIVADLYSDLLLGFQGCGITLDRLEFFRLHIECDDDHAETMHQIITRSVSGQPLQQLILVNAADIAVQARLRFFDGIYQRCTHD